MSKSNGRRKTKSTVPQQCLCCSELCSGHKLQLPAVQEPPGSDGGCLMEGRPGGSRTADSA